LATVFEHVYILTIVEPDFPYPRLDYNAGCVFSQFRVDIDSHTVVNYNDVDVLSGIVHLMKPNGSRYYAFESDVENFNGKYRADQFRVKINFTDFMSLFRNIIPMKYIGRQ